MPQALLRGHTMLIVAPALPFSLALNRGYGGPKLRQLQGVAHLVCPFPPPLTSSYGSSVHRVHKGRRTLTRTQAATKNYMKFARNSYILRFASTLLRHILGQSLRHLAPTTVPAHVAQHADRTSLVYCILRTVCCVLYTV